MHFLISKSLHKLLTLVNCDVRIQLYLECTNSTLPSLVLDNLFGDIFHTHINSRGKIIGRGGWTPPSIYIRQNCPIGKGLNNLKIENIHV